MLRELSVLILLPLCGAQRCQWRFDDCVQVGESWAMQCNVTLHRLTHGLTQCGDTLQTKTIMLDSDEGIKFDQYCDIRRSCAIKPIWCPWESWSVPTRRCDYDRLAKRQRRRCCHPSTAKRDPRVKCSYRSGHESRRLPPLPCENDDDGGDLDADRDLFRDITIGCFCVLSVLLLVICCRCCRRWKSPRGVEVTSPQQSIPLPMPQRPPSPPPPVATRQQYGRVIRALQPPDDRDAPPAYLESHPLVSPTSPAYENTRSVNNEPPPPRYETTASNDPPPPSYQTPVRNDPPPPSYQTSASNDPPPPGYETASNDPPPPSYQTPTNADPPPPGYETAITLIS